ncbi:hypothetical protein GJAV_G00196310 [Gymnothorax javanicus]|nr:hypothetical protein GJAV_G00196310 [Gymnothorax javanicus]
MPCFCSGCLAQKRAFPCCPTSSERPEGFRHTQQGHSSGICVRYQSPLIKWSRFCRLGRVQAFISKNDEVPSQYSTAARHRSAGDDCHGDDGAEERTHAVTNVQQLELRAAKLEEQVRSLNDKYKRALADAELVRRRTQKFVGDAKVFGIQSFCRDLVEVADVLEQAARDLGEEAGPRQVLQLIQERLEAVFLKHGLEKMRPIGGLHDPYQHQVVCHVPAPQGVQPGAVAVVKQEGYKLHGRTIRHAQVGIAMVTQER